MTLIRSGIVAAFSLVSLAACSSDPAPRQDLGSAEQAVSQARAQDAPQYAPKAFGKAHGKLAQAQEALKKGDHARARRLADEAAVDAELAQATAESTKNRAELDEIQRSIKALKSQVHAMAAQPTAGAPTSLSNITQ